MRILVVNSLQQSGDKPFFCFLVFLCLDTQYIPDNVKENVADCVSQQVAFVLIKLDKALKIVVKDFWDSFTEL
jgi:hypothetical protein